MICDGTTFCKMENISGRIAVDINDCLPLDSTSCFDYRHLSFMGIICLWSNRLSDYFLVSYSIMCDSEIMCPALCCLLMETYLSIIK